MLKLLTFPGIDEDGNVFVQAIEPNKGLTKTASTNLMPQISSYIDGIKPSDKHLYVLVNALGAGEFYGSNINGDYFEESELNPPCGTDMFGYKTFGKSGVYRHHKNKDITRSMGKVVCSCYNPVMHRVELIIEIDREKAFLEGHKDLVSKLDKGEHPAVSMGCKVKHDVCSICGHKSKTRADYCSHTKHMMGKVFPDGRKVFVYNPKPRFFDISFVVIGADRTSYAMAKVASVYGQTSAEAAEQAGLRDGDAVAILKEKMASKKKISNMMKKIPGMSAKVMPAIENSEKSLPSNILDGLSKHPLDKVLTTSAASGIVLKPSEFQKIVLIQIGKPGLANRLEQAGRVFEPSLKIDRSVPLGNRMSYSPSVRDILLPMMNSRSVFGPVLKRRIIVMRSGEPSSLAGKGSALLKVGHVELNQGEEALLNKISDSYNGYREQLIEKIGAISSTITQGDYKLLSNISTTGLEDMMFESPMKKEAKMPLALLGVLPMSYLYGAHVRRKQRAGKSTGPLDRFVEKHPILAASVFVGLTRMGMALKERPELISKGLNNVADKLDL